ncbi:hypothetical protein MPL3365_270133 [Mesorhizobium plurifarium]|uniref:Uncharacterized protein n=1 Tax=Mesorhizobium plurifarium TaxID=69974 RepID=A0A090GCV6_MESPL|nr:hypothetical protein MPL3365_270133 [Mesorhizobium plurifarium]
MRPCVKRFTFALREGRLDTCRHWRPELLSGLDKSGPDSTRRQLLSDLPTARLTIGGLLFGAIRVWAQARSMRH